MQGCSWRAAAKAALSVFSLSPLHLDSSVLGCKQRREKPPSAATCSMVWDTETITGQTRIFDGTAAYWAASRGEKATLIYHLQHVVECRYNEGLDCFEFHSNEKVDSSVLSAGRGGQAGLCICLQEKHD
eukprot:1160643-Pelagomonas_calceolata.AAC.2